MNRNRIQLYWEMDVPAKEWKKWKKRLFIFIAIEVVVMIVLSLYFRMKLYWNEIMYAKFIVEDVEFVNQLTYELWHQFHMLCFIPVVLFGFGMLMIWSLPFYGVYRHYYRSNSIYTLMRVPGPRKEFYIGKLLPPVCFSLIWYGINSILYLVPYGMYCMLIPQMYQQRLYDSYELLDQALWFPWSEIGNIPTVCLGCMYIPVLLLLCILIERGRKRLVSTIIAIGIFVISVWFGSPFLQCMLEVEAAGAEELTRGIIGMLVAMIGGMFYIEKMQISQ